MCFDLKKLESMGIEKCDVFVVCKSFHFVMIFKFSKGNRNEELSSNASGVITYQKFPKA